MVWSLIVATALAGTLAQQSQSFTVTVNAPVAAATRLFGPIGESEWDSAWKPVFVHPSAPGAGGDREAGAPGLENTAQRAGMVFTRTTDASRTQLWTLTEYDERTGRVAYVIVEPGYLLSEIQVQISADGPERSRATILHRRSALDEHANALVLALTPEWARTQAQHWEAAINRALRPRSGQPRGDRR